MAVLLAWSAGSNNAANLIAAAVGARVLKLEKALLTAAVFELLGSVMLGSAVALTLSTGIVDASSLPEQAMRVGVLTAMLAAGLWILTASAFKVPVSINETVLAGLVGFGVCVGPEHVQWVRVALIYVSRLLTAPISGAVAYLLKKKFASYLEGREGTPAAWYVTLFAVSALTAFLTLENILGLSAGLLAALSLSTSVVAAARTYVIRSVRTQQEREGLYERVLSSTIVALMALSHGASNAGVVAGPVVEVLNARTSELGWQPMHLMLAFSGLLMSLGMMSWGKRVVGTLGEELTTLSYPTAVVSYVASSTTVLIFAQLGIPVATTMAVTGSIVGAGLAEGYSAVNVKTLRKIVLMWLSTTPACITLTYALYTLASRPT